MCVLFLSKFQISASLTLCTNVLSVQGRIYVAKEYPTFERTMLIFCQKRKILLKNTLIRRQKLSALMKNVQVLG